MSEDSEELKKIAKHVEATANNVGCLAIVAALALVTMWCS